MNTKHFRLFGGFLALLTFVAADAFALPVLNMNSPGAESVTVFPDHADRNLYYLAPNNMVVARATKGLPRFSYLEYGGGLFGPDKAAVIQTTMRAGFDSSEIEKAKTRILAINPQAKFAGVTFVESKLIFDDNILSHLVTNSGCHGTGGMMGSEQRCTFLLNERGKRVLRPMLKRGLAITIQFDYSVDGVEIQADGKFVQKPISHRVAGIIGGRELACYPELFLDSDGNPIDDHIKARAEDCL